MRIGCPPTSAFAQGRRYLHLSTDAGLDFSTLTGVEIKSLRFPIQNSQGERLKEIQEGYLLWGVAILDPDGHIVGALLTYTDKQGNFEPGVPGYSLQARSLEQVTGLTWPEYSQRFTESPRASRVRLAG